MYVFEVKISPPEDETNALHWLITYAIIFLLYFFFTHGAQFHCHSAVYCILAFKKVPF